MVISIGFYLFIYFLPLGGHFDWKQIIRKWFWKENTGPEVLMFTKHHCPRVGILNLNGTQMLKISILSHIPLFQGKFWQTDRRVQQAYLFHPLLFQRHTVRCGGCCRSNDTWDIHGGRTRPLLSASQPNTPAFGRNNICHLILSLRQSSVDESSVKK